MESLIQDWRERHPAESNIPKVHRALDALVETVADFQLRRRWLMAARATQLPQAESLIALHRQQEANFLQCAATFFDDLDIGLLRGDDDLDSETIDVKPSSLAMPCLGDLQSPEEIIPAVLLLHGEAARIIDSADRILRAGVLTFEEIAPGADFDSDTPLSSLMTAARTRHEQGYAVWLDVLVCRQYLAQAVMAITESQLAQTVSFIEQEQSSDLSLRFGSAFFVAIRRWARRLSDFGSTQQSEFDPHLVWSLAFHEACESLDIPTPSGFGSVFGSERTIEFESLLADGQQKRDALWASVRQGALSNIVGSEATGHVLEMLDTAADFLAEHVHLYSTEQLRVGAVGRLIQQWGNCVSSLTADGAATYGLLGAREEADVAIAAMSDGVPFAPMGFPISLQGNHDEVSAAISFVLCKLEGVEYDVVQRLIVSLTEYGVAGSLLWAENNLTFENLRTIFRGRAELDVLSSADNILLSVCSSRMAIVELRRRELVLRFGNALAGSCDVRPILDRSAFIAGEQLMQSIWHAWDRENGYLSGEVLRTVVTGVAHRFNIDITANQWFTRLAADVASDGEVAVPWL